MVRTHNHLVVGVIIQAFDIVIYVVRFRDVSAELLANQLPAYLAPIAIQELEVLSNLPVQFSDPRHPLTDDETRFGIYKIIIEFRFDAALLLVFDHVPVFLQIVCNDRFQNIAVIVLCRINRKVFLHVFRQRYGFLGTGRLQAFGMFDV